MEQGSVQKREVQNIFGKIKDVQDLDYVTCWYKLAAEYIQNTKIQVCFVSTNSICQGSQSDYRYSKEIVYNTFPWPKPTEEQKIKIEQTAQMILNAREQYSDCSLADMYGEKMYLFPELVKAHQDNDRAVMQAYGFTKGSELYMMKAWRQLFLKLL